jgi:hypothetical protein
MAKVWTRLAEEQEEALTPISRQEAHQQTVLMYVLPPLLRKLKTEHPQLEINLKAGLTVATLAMLKSNARSRPVRNAGRGSGIRDRSAAHRARNAGVTLFGVSRIPAGRIATSSSLSAHSRQRAIGAARGSKRLARARRSAAEAGHGIR